MGASRHPLYDFKQGMESKSVLVSVKSFMQGPTFQPNADKFGLQGIWLHLCQPLPQWRELREISSQLAKTSPPSPKLSHAGGTLLFLCPHSCILFFFFFLLEYNCFTTLCSFLLLCTSCMLLQVRLQSPPTEPANLVPHLRKASGAALVCRLQS